ncbi:glutaredoxin domain-containing cysteine-rich protein 2 [Silurus asotus]|uniref:Glutaredoxin domain-containing cysteine-rich protein 2 n=1 Tax=Silurus asotus TaxID=30991 RepID=A0AAD5FLU8_SILAS|nr:glutaredoxin domain-containing cysteine-rich protein 2 [Silurus asotus]
MEERFKKMGPRHEAKPRKVRFKLASSYSGRVLKHVYEDGQELDSPEEKYPHSFIHTKIPQHLDVEQLCSFEGQDVDPPAGLTAQRINVYRAASGFIPLTSNDQGENEPVLDFEKIIIYTSNLKIIRSPSKKAESVGVNIHRGRGEEREVSPGREVKSKGRHRTKSVRKEGRHPAPKQEETGGCEQCGGLGAAPCSLCHGSKLSMLANRFNESIRELRCPACDPHGLQPCHSCVQ